MAMSGTTGNAPIDYTPDVLLNRGVPVEMWAERTQDVEIVHIRFDYYRLALLDREFEKYEVLDTRHGSVVERNMVPDKRRPGSTREAKIKTVTMDDVTVRKILYGQEALQAASLLEPVRTVLRVFGVVLAQQTSDVLDADGRLAKIAGRLIPAHLQTYIASINAAIQLANGADPTLAAESLATAEVFAAAQREQAEQALRDITAKTQEAIEKLRSGQASTENDEAALEGS